MPYKNKVNQKVNHRKWHIENRNTVLQKQKEYRRKIKLLVLGKYSHGQPKCECCSETRIEFLAIDHINGGGTKHRKKIGTGYLYFWLIKNNFPVGFRILCHNCNQAIGMYGKCPHSRD